MVHFTDLTGLASIASAVAAAMLQFPVMANLAKLRLAMLLFAVFVVMMIPIGGIPLAAYARGVTGDLSITTLVLLWCALLRPYCNCVMADAKQRHALLILIAIAAAALYPMALGAGTYDPYRLGYGNSQFVVALLLVALVAWLGKFMLISLCIALATFAWAVGWYESGNLWDYLLDPFVSTYALAAITIQFVKELLKSRG